MKAVAVSAAAVALAGSVLAIPAPVVDTAYPYTGPEVPVGDWVNPSVANPGSGKGFPRIAEAPAVKPCIANPTNNINVISMAFIPGGMNIHFQTPFGINTTPSVKWSDDPSNLYNTAYGKTSTYPRVPSCSELPATQCSEFFHDVAITGLQAGKEYFYQIPGGNGTTESTVLSFTTAIPAGNSEPFSLALVADMGYTNAKGTHDHLVNAVNDGSISFVWHGGDISYADDWYDGILECASDWDVCYNGSSTELPIDVPFWYKVPLPEGEFANQGGPQGGDASVVYESNWDEWQNWMNPITNYIPYMVGPGNHEASCAEFDGETNQLSAYLDNDVSNSSWPESTISYYSCPVTQRNYTTYQHRFTMPGGVSGTPGKPSSVGNFWYSYDVGLAHFITFDGETDYYESPEWSFIADTEGEDRHPLRNETFINDAGPFGFINGSYKVNANYEQYQWLKADLAAVNRTKTPWVFAMSHRPMYSSEVSSYQTYMRNAFEALLIEYNVDAYFSGHIHWYERMWPMGLNQTIHHENVINNNTYKSQTGNSLIHLVQGMAGNIESHSILDPGQSPANITAFLDQAHYGFTKLSVLNATTATYQFIRGIDGAVGDHLTIVKA